MAEVTVLTGSQLSDRRAQIDEVLQQHWGRAILLLPSHRLVQSRRDHYLASTETAGMLGSPFKTFDQLASEVLEREGECAETLSDFQRTLLIQDVVSQLREAGGLGIFEDACSTPGFAAHALRIITQLKQAGIDHERFASIAADRERASGFDPIVSALYAGYQEAIIATHVYDRVGVIWKAETLSRDGEPKALSEVDVLLLDAFDDFTPSELRLIDALSTHVSKTVFGFAFAVNDPSQEDLYALPRATSHRVCSAFGVDFPKPCSETSSKTFSMFVAQHLFWRSPPNPPPEVDRNLALVEYRDAWTEVEATGRTIKSLILDGVAPESIAVLHRSLSDVAPTLRCVFTEFGIPTMIIADESLRENAIATFLLEMLEASEAWERDRIAGILASRWFSMAVEEEFDTDGTFLLARAAGVIQGHRDWSRGLESLYDRLTSAKGHQRLTERLADPAAACNALRWAVARLHEMMEAFPKRGIEAAFVDGLVRVMDTLRLADVVSNIPDELAGEENGAIDRLYELLRKWQAWCCDRKEGARITRSEFVIRLRRALHDTRIGGARVEGGVWCASMEEARHQAFAHVFLIGMNEGTVPRPAPVNAIYGRTDLEAFAKMDVELDSHERHTEREMLLLHRSLATAEERCVISWHVVDAGGKARVRSPFIADIESVSPGDISIESGEAPLVTPDRAASPRDLAASIPVHASVEAALNPEYVQRFNAGAAIERARLDASPFAVYDGVIEDDSVLRLLAKRFDESHTFSVNQFETYASCPFRFFVERVLAIPEDLPPDAAIDPRDRGQMLHHVLRAFHEQYVGRSVSELSEADVIATLDGCIESVFEPLLRYGSPHSRTLWHVEQVRARKVLTRHMRTAAAKDDAKWKPNQFEVSFGRGRREDDESPDRTEAFVLNTPAGPIRFSGQIDRVDGADDAVRIVDYKTSLHIRKKDTQSGDSLQLPIYGLAWNSFHVGQPCREASFVEIGSHKMVKVFAIADDWEALADVVRTRVGELTNGIREGRFPPEARKGGCGTCSGRRACRYEQGRIERKQAADS